MGGDGQNEGSVVATFVRLLGANLEAMRLFDLLAPFPYHRNWRATLLQASGAFFVRVSLLKANVRP